MRDNSIETLSRQSARENFRREPPHFVPAERQGNDPSRRAHADEVDRPLRRAMLIRCGVSRLALASRSEPDWTTDRSTHNMIALANNPLSSKLSVDSQMEKPGETAGTVLVAVPGGKGLMSTLAKQGFRVRACRNLAEVIKHFDRSTDAIVLAQATLAPSKIHLLAKAVATQPPWSDVPVILLAKAGSGGKKASQHALEILGGNLLVLPPPFRVVALVTALRAVVQRRRQQRAALRAIRDLLEQREAALASISDAF